MRNLIAGRMHKNFGVYKSGRPDDLFDNLVITSLQLEWAGCSGNKNDFGPVFLKFLEAQRPVI